MSITVESRTDRGLIRELNEDAIIVMPDCGVVILADGMGGYKAGEVASQLAAETVASHLKPCAQPDSEAIVAAVELANDAIIASIEQQSEHEGMATTIALAHFNGTHACIAHVGDSRIYRYRSGHLSQMTVDHSMAQELVNRGMFSSIDEAQAAGVKKNILTRGVGIDPKVQVDVEELKLSPGDLYLFCSDGLTDMVEDIEIGEILGDPDLALAEMADRLVETALLHGGKDNVSVILVGI